MSWRQLLWPLEATLAERLFRWVAALSGLFLAADKLLPSSSYAFPLVNLLLLGIGGPSLLLFPFLASHLLRKAAARRPTDDAWRGLLRLGTVLLLVAGIAQALLLLLVLLLSQLPFEFEPRADGDSFFG